MNKTVFISQPMNGLDEKEIKRIRKKVQCHFSMQGDVIADTLFDFDDIQVEMTMDLLMQKNLIDDVEYTQSYFQKATRLGMGINKIIHHLKKEGVNSLGLFYLARSLEEMAYCDIAYFCKGWEKARGCRIEHEAAVAYGLEIIYE